MTHPFQPRALMLPMALAMLLSPAAVLAQAAAAPAPAAAASGAAASGAAANAAPAGLETVIVTAEKRRADAQRTALSMQVMNGDQLQREGKKRLDDVVDGLPGVQIQPSATGATLSIRGLDGGVSGAGGGSNAQADPSANPGVAVIIDGVYQARPEALRGGMLDTARVELLRGSQSTNLGGNSLVGALNLVQRQPLLGEYGGSASAEVGSYNRQSFTGVVNAPLGEDHAFRIAFQSSKRDGYTSSNSDNEDNQTLRLKYRWNPNDALNLVLTAERSTIGGTGLNQGSLLYQGNWVPANASTLLPVGAGGAVTGKPGTTATGLGCVSPPRNTSTPQTYATLGCAPTYLFNIDPATSPTYRDRANPWDDGLPANGYQNNPHTSNTLTTYSANLEYDLGFGSLQVLPSWQTFDRYNLGRVQGTTTSISKLSQDTEQLDLRLASPERADSPLKWLAGASWFRTEVESATGFELYPGSGFGSTITTSGGRPATYTCPAASTGSANCYIWGYTPSSVQETKSVYGNLTYAVLPSLRALVGMRYQTDKKSVVSSVFNYLGGTLSGEQGINFQLPGQGGGEWHKLTHRAGLEYDLAPSAMLYLTAATGYQPGQLAFDISNTASPQVVAGPESTLKQLTAGFKSRFLDNRLQLNVEAFASKFSKYQLNASTVLQGYNVATNSASGPCAHPQGTPQGTQATLSGNILCAQDQPLPGLSSKGVDIDLVWALTPQDRLVISAEYLKTLVTGAEVQSLTPQKIIDSVTSRGGSVTADQAQAVYGLVSAAEQSVVGYRPANSPRLSLSASYQHTFDLGQAGRLTPRLQATHKSEYWTSGQGTSLPITNNAAATQPSYTLVNAYLNWTSADGKLDISAYVRNATNQVVLQNLNTGPQPWWTVTLGAPRTYGLSTSLKF